MSDTPNPEQRIAETLEAVAAVMRQVLGTDPNKLIRVNASIDTSAILNRDATELSQAGHGGDDHGRGAVMLTLADQRRAALLQAILDEPDADDRRLVYADFLEEQGEPERSEFIRVQCELARLEKVWEPDSPQHHLRNRESALRRREGELLAAGILPPPIPDAIVCLPGHEPPPAHVRKYSAVFVVCRGFISSIVCRCEDWCGRACRLCSGRGSIERPVICGPYLSEDEMRRIADEAGGDIKCPSCRDSGRIGGHGREIIKVAPLEKVSLSDKKPSRLDNGAKIHGWTRSRWQAEAEDELPECLFLHLPAVTGFGSEWGTSGGIEAANKALSTACLNWARAQPVTAA